MVGFYEFLKKLRTLGEEPLVSSVQLHLWGLAQFLGLSLEPHGVEGAISATPELFVEGVPR